MTVPVPSELSGLLTASDPAAREQAWASFVGAHSRLLLHTARSIAHDYDAAMEAYAYILESLRRDDFKRLRAYASDGRAKFTTWLVVVARRLCLDQRRHTYGRVRNRDVPSAEAHASRRRLVDLIADQLDLSGPNHAALGNPETELRARELKSALREVLEGLDPPDRLLLRLRFGDDLSAREIADVMRLPTPFHVYRKLNSLLESLRRSLRRAGIEDAEP